MKKLTLSLLLFFCIKSSIAQYYNKPFNDIVDTLNLKLKNKDQVNNTINGIIINSELYNTLWKNFITQAISDNDNVWKPLKDFNIQFKTFETRDNPTASLGFTYDFNYDFAKYTEQNKNRISNSFGLTAKGNVAFNKIINPVDFLETRAHYNYSHFI